MLANAKRATSPARHLPGAGAQITRTVAAISAAGLIIASAGLGALYAWSVGAQHGTMMATLLVIMAACLELAKPLSVSAAFNAFRNWSPVRSTLLAALAIVAVGYSLTAELSLMAASRGGLVAKRESVVEQHDDRRERVKAARAELANLAPSRTIEEAKGDMARLRATNPKVGDCKSMTTTAERWLCPQLAKLQVDGADETPSRVAGHH